MQAMKPDTWSPALLPEPDPPTGAPAGRVSAPSPSTESLWRGRDADDDLWDICVPVAQALVQGGRQEQCSGGRPGEQWLPLERVQNRPCGSFTRLEDLVFPNGTGSVPTLHSETQSQSQSSGCDSSDEWSSSPALCSEELFTPGRRGTDTPLGHSETGQGATETPPRGWEKDWIRCTPGRESVRLCTLTSMGNRWLPLRKRAVVLHLPRQENTPDQIKVDPYKSSTWYKLNSSGSRHTDGKVIEICSNSMGFRSWRFPSQSSPNICEAAENNSTPSLNRDAPSPWAPLGTGWEERERERERGRTSPFLFGLTHSADPLRRASAPPRRGPILSKTLSVPEPLLFSGSGVPHAGLSSITISARRVPLAGERPTLASRATRPPTQPNGVPASPTATRIPSEDMNAQEEIGSAPVQGETGSPPVVLRHRPAVVKVTEYRERYRWDAERPLSSATPEHRHSYSEGERWGQGPAGLWMQGGRKDAANRTPTTSPQRPTFRSCAHLEVPCRSASSALYLDKSMSVSLRGPLEGGAGLHRSTLSLSLGRPARTGTPVGYPKAREERCPRRACSAWDISDSAPGRIPGHPSPWSREGPADPRPAASDPLRSAFPAVPFRGRFHSSAALRLNGNANGPARPAPPPSRLRSGEPALSNSPETMTTTKMDSPLITKATSTVVTVRCQRHQEKTNSFPAPDSDTRSPTGRGIVLDPGACAGSLSEERGRGGRTCCAEMVRRVAECPSSPHAENCVCGSRTCHPLSLKEALAMFRPDFISRSQGRVLRLEQRVRERLSLRTPDLLLGAEPPIRRRNCTKPHPLCDNLFKPRERTISGKEMQQRSKRIYKKLPEVTRKKEEERKRLVLQTNRLRAEIFKKKLLDQILQRNSD